MAWAAGPEALELPAGEIHVWSVRLPLGAEQLSRLERLLSEEERGRLQAGRARFVAVRGLLRVILGNYLDVPADALRFAYGPHGKPALIADGPGEGVRFNLSHAADAALLAFARGREVGVDVERVREVPRADRIAARVFPPEQLAEWQRLPQERRLPSFFAEWTRLEALAKLRGDGVWRTLIQGAHREARDISHFELAPFPGYVGALAVEGSGMRLRCWSWGGGSPGYQP